MIVIDASVMVAWLLNEPGKLSAPILTELLAQHEVVVPTHWTSEVGNALVTNRRRNRIPSDDLDSIILELSRFQISPEPPLTAEEFATTVSFALGNGLTFYDAAYVKLAISTESILATLDDSMRRVALKFGIALVP